MINHTLEEHARALADYMPGGRMFESGNITGSNLNQLMKGLAGEMGVAEDYLITLEEEYPPDQTTLFIDEWERAVGIPDDCFNGTGPISERRTNVIIKLVSLGVQTASDLVALGVLFGVVVTVTPGRQVISFPLTFPVTMINNEQESRFTAVVEFAETEPSNFPLTFPIKFGSKSIGVLECLFAKLKPANVSLIFKSTS